MKILTATATTQGRRPGDFNYCIEGELVWIGLVCATDRGDPDGGCGCGRAFGGMSSHRATTTAMIRDVATDRRRYTDALRASLEAQRWPTASADRLADGLIQLVDDWPVGTVVERRLDAVNVRDWPRHA
ncbi:hypothetical protein [Frankia sp. QA3]|uniref:DUF7715 family protein n=1 Tax=Frankia sp. QA3 TaxID=710111 RepID=UPI000269CB3E|nr:hypothetical protein [Frankia sp. QA3]EIV95261.1 hypothetical protein FraQA3DRAFT_5069 [Frankia sp. QA3]